MGRNGRIAISTCGISALLLGLLSPTSLGQAPKTRKVRAQDRPVQIRQVTYDPVLVDVKPVATDPLAFDVAIDLTAYGQRVNRTTVTFDISWTDIDIRTRTSNATAPLKRPGQPGFMRQGNRLTDGSPIMHEDVWAQAPPATITVMMGQKSPPFRVRVKPGSGGAKKDNVAIVFKSGQKQAFQPQFQGVGIVTVIQP